MRPLGLTVVTPASGEPISLDAAKTHCRVSSLNTTENDLIQGLIVSAREHIERIMDRTLVSKRYKLTLDFFRNQWEPRYSSWGRDEIVLPRGPVQAVESVKYLDMNGTQQTLSTGVYLVDTATDPGRIIRRYNQYWPVVLPESGAVEVTYVAGYGPVTTGTLSGSTCTPASMFGIYAGTILEVEDAVTSTTREIITVATVGASTFTATFANSYGGGMVINAVPRAYQQAMKLLCFDWYWTRGDAPPPGLTGLAMPNGVQALLQGQGHGWVF